MRRLLLTSLILLCAPAVRAEKETAEVGSKADDSYRAAYKALKSEELEAKLIDKLPDTPFREIDVSERMRSASFGHSTKLLVPTKEGQTKREFFVQYGRSTNRPARTFGPFLAP
jgi:hypothetical protein